MKNKSDSKKFKFRIWELINSKISNDLFGPQLQQAGRKEMLRLADHLETSEKNMYRIAGAKEGDTIDMNSSKLKKVAEFFGVTTDEMLTFPPTIHLQKQELERQQLAA